MFYPYPLLGRMQCVAVSSSCFVPSLLPPHSQILTSVIYIGLGLPWLCLSSIKFPFHNACWSVLRLTNDTAKVTNLLEVR